MPLWRLRSSMATIKWLLALLLAAEASIAGAAERWNWSLVLGAGTMQQPSSQYYLLAYSASAGLVYKPANTSVQITALGRPEFHSASYQDQDYGGFIEIHQTLAERGALAVDAGIGGGQMRGYIKSDSGDRSDYRMSGPSCSMSLVWTPHKKRKINVRVKHRLFSALSTSAQTDARVSWPWTSTILGLGMML